MTLASSYLLEREALNSWRLISRQRTLPEGRSELQPKQLCIQTPQLAFVFSFLKKRQAQTLSPLLPAYTPHGFERGQPPKG